MKITKITMLAGVATTAFASLGVAHADLYISPVKSYQAADEAAIAAPGEEVSHRDHKHDDEAASGDYLLPSEVVKQQAEAAHGESDVKYLSTEIAVEESLLADKVEASLPCYGKDVPIDIVVSTILGDDYSASIQEGYEKERLTWSGDSECMTKEDIIALINESNPVHLTVNDNEKIVGVAGSEEFSGYFSHGRPQVWHADSTLSITENLTKWVESVGWKVEWPDIISEIDFETAETTLYGPLIGEGALFHRVLMQVADRYPNTILSVEFYPNKYIVVSEGGFTKQ